MTAYPGHTRAGKMAVGTDCGMFGEDEAGMGKLGQFNSSRHLCLFPATQLEDNDDKRTFLSHLKCCCNLKRLIHVLGAGKKPELPLGGVCTLEFFLTILG